MAVCLVEAGKFLAVDVQHTYDLIVGIEDRYDNLRPRETAAGDMTRKLLHIRYDDRLTPFPCRATDPTSEGYLVTSHRSLERTKSQLFVTYEVEARPPPAELRMEGCTDIGHHADGLLCLVDESLQLWQEGLIFRLFVHFSISILASTATTSFSSANNGLMSISLISVAKRSSVESRTMISAYFCSLSPFCPRVPLMIL